MEFFWQSYLPQPVIISVGNIAIHWYGLIVVLAIIVAGWYILARAKNKPVIRDEQIDSLFFYLIIFGFISARLYHVVFFNWNYFSHNLIDIGKVWQGGLAIQGAILAGVITLYCWSKKNNFDFWPVSDWLVPALALGQAIGRWGNYFNQELFGLPTDGWWGIPIAVANRVPEFSEFTYFHPTFFYESVLDLILFIILLKLIKTVKGKVGLTTLVYLGGYSLIRFALEFVRIDTAPETFGVRLPQIISLLVILIVVGLFIKNKKTPKIGIGLW